ncbi:MAG TPA: hypothetical protein VGB83_11670 [Actinomycetota bacterium]
MRRTVLLSTILVLAGMPAMADPPTGVSPKKIAGTWRYQTGKWIYTDFVYDDYGADTIARGQPNVVTLAPTAGDFRYPGGDTEAGNAADIVEVRVRISPPDDDDLRVHVRLQSLVDPALPAIWVSVDGAETIVTEHNADEIDPTENTIMFTLPGAAAGGGSIALNVGAGLHDGDGGLREGVPGSAYAQPDEFTTGGPTEARLFDLAFNTRALEGRGGAWNEDVQSRLLAEGDLEPFAQTIDLDALAANETVEPPVEPGYAVRIFESRQDLGEGMRGSFPQYRGRLQPYALWIPEDYDPQTPTPLLLNLHSLSVHHNQYRGGEDPAASYSTMYEQVEDGLGAIVVTPLARGPDGWYQDEALIDTLEVWADAVESFNIDPDRVYVGGYSMGGFGTYRLATLMPDSFASAVSIVGPPADGIWAYPAEPTGGADDPTFTHPQLESTLHVPFWITQGVEDELVPFTGVTVQAQRFGELGHEYRYALHPVGDHFAFAFLDEWSREIGWLASHPTRVTDPRRVTLDVRPASWASGADATILGHLHALVEEIGARLDGAYWVGDVVIAGGDDVTGEVDLTSGGIPSTQTGVASVTAPGVDGPSPYLLTGQDKVFGDVAAEDSLTGRLSGVTSVTVDVERAGLSDAPAVAVTSNVPATITFVRDGAVVGSVAVG